MDYLYGNGLLHDGQHDFTRGKSTLTNLLTFDSYVSDCVIAGYSFDIIAFDSKKAFEKASHNNVVRALTSKSIGGRSLQWFASFLQRRTHQVIVENQLSGSSEVISGVVKGSVLEPDLFAVLANSLLERMKLPRVAFVDDFKFVGDITIYSHAELQGEVDMVADWSEEMNMPLSVEKSVAMHCGAKQPNYD